MPQLEMKGKQPGWSVEIMALSFSNSIENGLTRWSQEIGDLGGAKGGSGRRGTGSNEVLLTPFWICLMQPMIDGTKRGRYLLEYVGLVRMYPHTYIRSAIRMYDTILSTRTRAHVQHLQ